MVKQVNSIEEFLEEIFIIQNNIDEYNNSIENFLHKGVAFRGQEDMQFQLIPAIGRGRRFSSDISILNQERNLIEMSKMKLPHLFSRTLMPIDLLALLQHYGVPTRLLDVTSNPLVALYFASLNDDVDGEVIIFEYNDGNKAIYPVVNAIAESYKFSYTTWKDLSLFYEDVIKQSYFDEQRNQISYKTPDGGGRWIQECCKDLLFVNAIEQLERQKLQQGFYILFPNRICNDEKSLYFDKIIDPIDKEDKQINARIIVTKSAKIEIRKKLSILGITEATLFADNIDIVCKDIVEQCKKGRL